MQLVGRAQVGPGLLDHRGDRLRIEAPDVVGHRGGQPAPQRDRAGPPLLERGVVEIGVGVGVQDLVGEHGGLRRLARHPPDLAGVDRGEAGAQAVDVHRLGQAVAQGLAHQRVVGHLDRPRPHVVLAGELGREHRDQQILRAHALEIRRHAPAVLPAQQGERPVGVPAPAGVEHGRLERGLGQQLLEPARVEHLEDRLERKAVLGTEREQHAVVGGRGLQLEVEAVAEPLAQRHAPRAIDAAAEGRVDHHLHAARLVEEALHHHRVARRHRTQRGAGRRDVVAREQGPAGVEPGLALEPLHRRVPVVEAVGHALAHRGQLGRELERARGPLAEPERDRGRRAPRVLHPDPPALDAADAPGGVAEQDDVARHRLDGEVLVERADRGLVRLQHDLVVGVVRDRAARGDRGETGAAAGLELPPDRVAVQPRRVAAAPGRDALGQHVDDLVELAPVERGVGRGAAAEGEEPVLVLLLARADRDHLLGQDVQRCITQ